MGESFDNAPYINVPKTGSHKSKMGEREKKCDKREAIRKIIDDISSAAAGQRGKRRRNDKNRNDRPIDPHFISFSAICAVWFDAYRFGHCWLAPRPGQ